MVEVEQGVLAEGLGRVRVSGLVQSMQGCCGQPIPSALPFRSRPLQPITQRHQFIHFGDDAVLLGEGREWELCAEDAFQSQLRLRHLIGLFLKLLLNKIRVQRGAQILRIHPAKYYFRCIFGQIVAIEEAWDAAHLADSTCNRDVKVLPVDRVARDCTLYIRCVMYCN